MIHTLLKSFPLGLFSPILGLTIATLTIGTTLIPLPSIALTASSINPGNLKVNLSETFTEAQAQTSGAARVTVGNTTIYIGTKQVSANDQNPIVLSYTSGIQDWFFFHEQTPPDSRGIGLLVDYNGTTINSLYAAFTTDGGSTDANGIQRFTTGGWLNSYGSGGGPYATVLLKLDPNNGNGIAGTFVRSQLSNGNTNTLIPTGLAFDGSGNVVLKASAYFSPLAVDKTRLDVSGLGSSPFAYTLTLSPNLSSAISASVGTATPAPVPFEADSSLGLFILAGLGGLFHYRRSRGSRKLNGLNLSTQTPNPQES
jgi:hypothetical protein